MADTNINLADFLADGGDDELVFDDMTFDPPAPAPDPAPAPAPEPAPEPVAETSKPRRAPRRGRDAVTEAAAGAAPSEPPASASSERSAASEEPADPPAPVPQPDAGSAGFDRRSAMLLAIVVLSLFTSLLSLGGVFAVGRTLAHTQADRAHAKEERDELARVPAIVKALDDASARLAVAASRTPASPPATAEDVRRSLDELRVALAAHQPDGMASLNGVARDGFTELGTRVSRMQADIDAIARAVNANRKAPRAADPEQPS